MRTHNIPSCYRKSKRFLIFSHDLALLSTLTGSNYFCLELIFMVPKVFEPLKFDCISTFMRATKYSTELNDLGKNLRKSEVSVERISVCNFIEKLEEHGIHCTMTSFQVMSLKYYSVKVLSTTVTVGYSLVAILIDL